MKENSISYVNCLTYSLVTIYLHHLTLWVYMFYIVGFKFDDLPSIIKKTTVNTIVKISWHLQEIHGSYFLSRQYMLPRQSLLQYGLQCQQPIYNNSFVFDIIICFITPLIMITAGNNDTSFFCDLTYLLSFSQLNIIECEILNSNLFGYDFDHSIIRLKRIHQMSISWKFSLFSITNALQNVFTLPKYDYNGLILISVTQFF